MGVIQFDIRHPNGQRESAVIEGERALIGSGAHCDVRLPMDQAAYEHVLIEVIGGNMRAEAKADHATINNMPLQASPLAPDSVLGVGRIRMFVAFVPDVGDNAQVPGGPQKKEAKPVVQLALVAGFAAAAFLLLHEEELKIPAPPTQTPQLFADEAVACPRADKIQAVAFGEEQLELAHGKRERMPFSMTDGVAAVGLYRTAAACFRFGGAEADAKDADEEERTLREALSNEFRARRLRLTYTLKTKDYDLARQDVAVLLSMTRGKQGPYVQWLAQTQKQLPAPVKKKVKKKPTT